jgi:hypothetical protein
MDWWQWALASAVYTVPGGWTAWVMTLACMRMDMKESLEKGNTITASYIRENASINTALGVFLGLVWPLTLVLRFPTIAVMRMHEMALARMAQEFLPPPDPPDLRASDHAAVILGEPWTRHGPGRP